MQVVVVTVEERLLGTAASWLRRFGRIVSIMPGHDGGMEVYRFTVEDVGNKWPDGMNGEATFSITWSDVENGAVMQVGQLVKIGDA